MLVLFGFFSPMVLAASLSGATTYAVDPEALNYSQMKVSMVSPDVSYLNIMTSERVKATPHVTIESRERVYIAQIFATLPVDKMSACKIKKPESIFLTIEFSGESTGVEFHSDGSSLYSSDYKLCTPVGKDFLDRFDLRARMTK